MTESDRRRFLRILGSTAIAAAVPDCIARALAIPANRRTGTIRDVEHIVILMQENRSFDHYFGSLRGVRGFGDPRPVTLRSGKSVWHQPGSDGDVLPFRPAAHEGAQFLADLPHDWASGQKAWNGGHYDCWVTHKTAATMAHLTRDDIPYHYALADAFTICDAYHCSVMGPTDPNRYYLWTGCLGNNGSGGGPVVDNAAAGCAWPSFPERLEQAGISWKIYQDVGTGLDAAGHWGWTDNAHIGNYGDNALLGLRQYRDAQPGSPLYEKARRGTRVADGGTLFDILRADTADDKLPQVSWIVAPEAFTEHPNWPPNYGAWYISQIIDALTAVPEVWSKTALFITYDENDGFFDHVVPPCPPLSATLGGATMDTADELFPGRGKLPAGPYGLGARVPMLVISPWSKGGYVCSEVFDHTSLIRFVERRFGPTHPDLIERQISPWRRAVCGDLTSAFNFAAPDAEVAALPSTAGFAPPDRRRRPDHAAVPPIDQALPAQETGLRAARPLPYELHADGAADFARGEFRIDFRNAGKAGACFQVRTARGATDGAEGPWSYTVEAGKSLSGAWDVAAGSGGEYDFSVHGPNGFLRRFAGSVADGRADLAVELRYDVEDIGIVLTVANRGPGRYEVTAVNAYTGAAATITLDGGESVIMRSPLQASFGWYDVTITVDTDAGFHQHFAGHVETGEDSMSDPAFAPT
jgi:phospholipase C